MGIWTLEITITSAMALEAHDDVYLVVSLSGDQKHRAPVHKKGSSNPWSGHTFVFTVNEDAILADGCLKFKIKKAERIFRLKKGVGEVDVPVRDLLKKAFAGDTEQEVLRYEVKSLSGEIQGVLQFYCKLLPPPAIKADEPVTVSPSATALPPPASYTAAAHLPPTGVAPSPVTDYPAAMAVPASNPAVPHPPPTWVASVAAEPVIDYPAAMAVPTSNPAVGHPPPTGTALPPSMYTPPELVTDYLAARAPPASNLAAAHQPPTEAGLPLSVTAMAGYPPSGMLNAASSYGYLPHPAPPLAYPLRANMHPSAGYGLAAPARCSPGVYPPSGMPNAVSNYSYPPPAGYLPNPAPPQGYPPRANMHPPTGYWRAGPQPYASENIAARVGSGVAVDTMTDWIDSFNIAGSDDGASSDAWF